MTVDPQIDIPPPRLGFPQHDWLEKYLQYCACAARRGLELGWSEAPTDRDFALPEPLQQLYSRTDGLGLGFVDVIPALEVQSHTDWIRGEDWAAIPADDLQQYRHIFLPFARDGCDNYYVYVPASGISHCVVYLCHDPPGWEHRFTSMETFLDAMLARAYAAALHRKAELEAERYLDDTPWLQAARALEMQIDPRLLRTRED